MIEDIIRKIVDIIESQGWKLYSTVPGSSIEECEHFSESNPIFNVEYRLLPVVTGAESLRDVDNRKGYGAGYFPALATKEGIIPTYRLKFIEKGVLIKATFRLDVIISYETAVNLFDVGFHIVGQTQPNNQSQYRLAIIFQN